MGNLLTSLLNSTGALQVYDRVFNVIQNNITNSNTPGYAKQDQALISMPFDPAQEVWGGVMAGPMLNSRSEYVEQDVRTQQTLLGSAQQRSSDLGQVEPLFDPTSTSGVAGSMNAFFNSFSQLGVNPNDASARQNVIDAASQVAQSFQQTSRGISQVVVNTDSQTRGAVDQINQLTTRIAGLNQQYRSNSAANQNAGLDAQMHTALEGLSSLVNFSLIKTADGATNVYLGGQTPLVLGDTQFALTGDFSAPQTVIRDAQSNDITGQVISGQVSGGSLGALLQEKNSTLPGYTAQLNTLAQSFADQANGQLSQGLDQSGVTPTTNLFSYNQASDAASSLAVTNIAPGQIAAAAAGAPGGNGNAIAMTQLASAAAVNGFTFTQAFGNLSAQVGHDVAQAQGDQTQAQDLVTQAQQQRQQQSGVSLDEEAAKLLQFQQSYEAVGKLVGVLDSLTQTLINMFPVQ
jgi:flagellar hook-associated protein 1 FlgK